MQPYLAVRQACRAHHRWARQAFAGKAAIQPNQASTGLIRLRRPVRVVDRRIAAPIRRHGDLLGFVDLAFKPGRVDEFMAR